MAAYAMLKRRCFYDPVKGVQYISYQSDELTSHPIEQVQSLYGAAADRDIVDVDLHTLEHKAVDGNKAFVVGGLVIDKVRTDVSFYLDDHGNLRCEKHACVNGNTCFLVRVCFVESATGRSIIMVDLIRTVYGQSVRRRCKILISYEPKHAYVQAEHFGRDMCVSHYKEKLTKRLHQLQR